MFQKKLGDYLSKWTPFAEALIMKEIHETFHLTCQEAWTKKITVESIFRLFWAFPIYSASWLRLSNYQQCITASLSTSVGCSSRGSQCWSASQRRTSCPPPAHQMLVKSSLRWMSEVVKVWGGELQTIINTCESWIPIALRIPRSPRSTLRKT